MAEMMKPRRSANKHKNKIAKLPKVEFEKNRVELEDKTTSVKENATINPSLIGEITVKEEVIAIKNELESIKGRVISYPSPSRLSDNIAITNSCESSEDFDIHIKPFIEATELLNELKVKNDLINTETLIPSAPELLFKDVLDVCTENDASVLIQDKLGIVIEQEPELSYEEIKPFTEYQLMGLYNNQLLDEKDVVIEDFLESDKKICQHEFYEIVLAYLHARTSLIGQQKDIHSLKNDYITQKEKAWIFEDQITTEEGMCEDDQLLTIQYKHQIASYQQDIAVHITKLLKNIRETVYDHHSIFSFRAELSKLNIENYLRIATSCSCFIDLPKYSEVSPYLAHQLSKAGKEINNLKDCISVLFSFCRRNIQDKGFIRDIRAWITELVAVLLRVADNEDHLFILNHLLRCPIGIGDWGSSFIQVAPPRLDNNQDILGSPELDYSMMVLTILCEPVKQRERFLQHFKSCLTAGDQEDNNDSIWVLVDSSGDEEDEHITDVWHLFNENDVVQLLNQVPFEAIFKHILLIDDAGDGYCYDITKSSEQSIMKLFAFCTCLLKILQNGLMAYSKARYKGVFKRITRLIRHVVHYVTDHLRAFTEYHRICPESSNSALYSRLLVEYDEFFERVIKSVFLSPRCSAWQFLAVIPYSSVSLKRLQRISYHLHIGYELETITKDQEFDVLLTQSDTKGRFQDLLRLNEEDAYYLLTALANMASCRPVEEREFINVLVSSLFDASFLNEDTKDMLSRTGRDLLSTVVESHSFVISTLLSLTQENLQIIGSLSLYLFSYLSFHRWTPTEDDLNCLCYWLLYSPTASLENQLSRLILERLNWGFDKWGRCLFLEKKIHQKVAGLVAEAALKVRAASFQGNILTEGVKHVTSAVYSPTHEQIFLKWCWSIMTQLRLHQLDQPEVEIQRMMMNQSLLLKGLPDPSTSPSLEFLKKGLDNKEPFALFTALLMSSWGHSLPMFCCHGPESLEVLISGGHYEAAATVISLVTPLFFLQHEELTSDNRFITTLQKILSSDQTYINRAKSLIVSDAICGVTDFFSSLIMEQMQGCKRFNLLSPDAIVSFWVHLLTSISDWRNNKSVLCILDVLCQQSLLDVRCWQKIKDVLLEQKKDIMFGRQTSHRGLGSLLTWVTAGGTSAPFSLLVSVCDANYPWYALSVLLLECQEKSLSVLWRELLKALQDDLEQTVDVALKKTCDYLNVEFFNSNYLSIYRFGQQLLGLKCDHPAFPATLQAFLTLHLTRVPSQPGKSECCSVIHKFYEGYINSNFLKKIKVKVDECVAHWSDELASMKKNISGLKEEDESLASEDQDAILYLSYVERLVSDLVAMKAWLDEPRIYESSLYLPALAPHFKPDRLLLLFQGNWETWSELLHIRNLEKEKQRLLEIWNNHRFRNRPLATSRQQLESTKDNRKPSEAILKRLKEYDPPKPPPPLPDLRPKLIESDNDFDADSVFYDIDRYMGMMSEFSHTIYVWSKELCALDCVYMEKLPELWWNPETKTILTAKCEPSRKSKRAECSGAASVVIKYNEKRLREGVNARLEQNREQYQSVLSQSLHSPPLLLCQGAIQLEMLVNRVVLWHKKLVSEGESSDSLVEYGRRLFYFIIEQTNEETSSYPPAKQLITTCVDILGQEFMHGHRDCQGQLVQQVLSWDSALAGLLSPHFTPLVTPKDMFLRLYSSLGSYASSKPDITFMLLSKFEIEFWLRSQHVITSSRSELIDIIGHCLISLLSHGDPATIMCLEMYRVHLIAILKYDFSGHFRQVLNTLLEMSFSTENDPGHVGESLWYDLLNIVARGIVTFSPDLTTSEISSRLRTFCHTQTMLNHQLISETVQFLSTYFLRVRLEHGLYGIYPKFKNHIKPVITLLGLLSHCHILIANQSTSEQSNEKLTSDEWIFFECLWAAWVSPLGGKIKESCPKWIQDLTMDRRLLLPWTPTDVTAPSIALAVFASCVTFFHEVFVGCGVLSIFLEYYHRTFASSEVHGYVVNVVHSYMSPLPWHHIVPNKRDLELFSKIINEYLPDCHSFIGNIFIQLPWHRLVSKSVANAVIVRSEKCSSSKEEKSEVCRIHVLMLGILVRISMEPSVRQSGLLHPLLISSESFAWEFLDGKKFEDILNWFMMGCDPRVVLNMDSRNPVDVSLIHLLHVAAGCMPNLATYHHEGPLKRRLLVRALVRLLIASSTRHKALLRAQPSLFRETYAIMLSHMEDTVTDLNLDQQYDEGLSLSSEIVAAIGGGASAPPLQEVCRDSTLQWLSGHHPTHTFLLALAASVSRGVLQLLHRSLLLERCLIAIHAQADLCGKDQTVSWSELVGILSFPLTNPLPMLSLAAQENLLLLIYAHTRWRLKIREASYEEKEIILANLMEVLNQVNPEEKCEKGLLLIVHEVLQLMKDQVERKENLLLAWKHTRRLADFLSSWGEDRSSSGLLAAIGLGRKSPLSISVRLVCKSLSTFLVNQLVSPGSFNIINEQPVSDGDSADSCEESLKCLKSLTSYRTNATYAEARNALDFAVTFVQDCCHSILDSPELFCGLVKMLFPKDVILAPLISDDDKVESESVKGEDPEDEQYFAPSAPPAF